MRRLFVLRPEPGASASVCRARDLGLDAIAMPLFAVEAIAWGVPEASSFDALLLTSANAVRHGGEQLKELRGLPAYAVGDATAEAARDAGFDIAGRGDVGVERLLGSIDPELKLLHLCGADRIETEARQKIARVPVYRSVELPPPESLSALRGQVAAVHSPRAGQRLASLTGDFRATIGIAAISPAAADAAGDGWEHREHADKPTDDALLALAARLCDKGRGR
jgi:uroporphyrinogen-III synthase